MMMLFKARDHQIQLRHYFFNKQLVNVFIRRHRRLEKISSDECPLNGHIREDFIRKKALTYLCV